MKYKPYPAYKDSGIPGMGEVPAHWEMKPTKRFADFFTGWTPPTGNSDYFSGNNLWANISDIGPRILNDTAKRISDEAVSVSRLKKSPVGSLLFSFKLSIGQVSIVGNEMFTNEAIATFPQYKDVNIQYLYWSAPIFIPRNAEDNIYGAKLLNQERIKNALFALPPSQEQEAIATFLDRETVKIDTLIAKQEHLIELLQEKRTALISHAVTKGLNPDVSMKDSGVEWSGEVPEHWVHTPIKHTLFGLIDTEHKTAPFFDDGEYFVVRTTNIKNGKIIFDGAKYTDEAGYIEWTRRGKPFPGDIIFTREAPAGEACLVPGNLPICIGQRTVLMRINHSLLESRFGLWSLYGGLASDFIAQLSQGSTVVHFNMSDIGNIPIMLPTLSEQKEIADFLDRETIKIDALIQKACHAIDLLKERRTALISAAVTGKIDVRDRV